MYDVFVVWPSRMSITLRRRSFYAQSENRILSLQWLREYRENYRIDSKEHFPIFFAFLYCVAIAWDLISGLRNYPIDPIMLSLIRMAVLFITAFIIGPEMLIPLLLSVRTFHTGKLPTISLLERDYSIYSVITGGICFAPLALFIVWLSLKGFGQGLIFPDVFFLCWVAEIGFHLFLMIISPRFHWNSNLCMELGKVHYQAIVDRIPPQSQLADFPPM